jgi:hypothetical protein
MHKDGEFGICILKHTEIKVNPYSLTLPVTNQGALHFYEGRTMPTTS